MVKVILQLPNAAEYEASLVRVPNKGEQVVCDGKVLNVDNIRQFDGKDIVLIFVSVIK